MSRKTKGIEMSTVPATVSDGFELPTLERAAKPSVLESLSSGRFLPRIQILQGLSKLVTQRKASSGEFVMISGSKVSNLGEQFDCAVLNVRAKALDMRGPKPFSVFNAEDTKFKEIREAADSGPRSKCSYGPEYLLYVPSQARFATVFFNTPTMRRSQEDMDALIQKPVTLTSQFIEKDEFAWYGVTVEPCVTPLTYPDDKDAFRAAIVEQNTKFCDTSVPVEEPDVELAEEETAGSRAR